MRIALLVGLLIASAACEGYQFPGPETGTGTVHGHVIASGCGGPVQPDAHMCPACPPSIDPAQVTCGGEWPIGGFELNFTNGGTSRIAKTDSTGAYSIDLPVGTWQVGAANYGRIVDGPLTVAVSVGVSVEADYTVDTGMRAAA
jgi:hypothetical protein